MYDYEELMQILKDFAADGTLSKKTIKAYASVRVHEILSSGVSGVDLRRAVSDSLRELVLETEQLTQLIGALTGDDHG